MVEKQYSLVYHADKGGAFIKNNETGTEWYHDSRASLLEIVNELNGLAEENKHHKERISLLSSLLDLADAIIDTSDNEKAKQVWDNKNEQTEKEWERILND